MASAQGNGVSAGGSRSVGGTSALRCRSIGARGGIVVGGGGPTVFGRSGGDGGWRTSPHEGGQEARPDRRENVLLGV
jgi:hypothetical protein